jgi:rhodanese-related sulfurtransferase
MDLLWWLPFGEVPEIDGEELYDQLQEAAAPVVIDVRTSLEFAQGHIAGALNVPITDLKSKLTSLKLKKNHPVVAICLSAHRSIPAVRLFEEAGIKKACQLQGGMLAWQKAGLPTIKPGEGE